jgi:hypothetical protein
MKEVQTFAATKATYDKRRLEALKNPTHDNCLAMTKAEFALSMAKLRLLRRVDTHGHLLINASKQAVAVRQALISFYNHDPSVQQTELGI